MFVRGEAIVLLVILAVVLAATVWVAAHRTPSFGVVLGPVEVGLAALVSASTGWDGPGPRPPLGPGAGRGGPPRRPGRGDGGTPVRDPRRPRPSSGAGAARRDG